MSRKRGVYILGAKRTPFGKFFGSLSHISAVELGSEAIKGLMAPFQLALNSNDIGVDGVILGNVYSAGLGLAPVKKALLRAGIPEHCRWDMVNKACASSLFALEVASERIQLGKTGLVVAGGMESMSHTPYLLERRSKLSKPGFAHRLDEIGGFIPSVIDSMIYDGLLDISTPLWKKMGELADDCARVHEISRETQEAYSFESFMRARVAKASGKFYGQVAAVGQVSVDECVREPDIDKMRGLNPTFAGGTATAATSAQISDGAAVLLLGDRRSALKLTGIEPRIRVVDFATHSQHPHWYTTAPVDAIGKILRRNKLAVRDISFFEINEAFAVVPLFAMHQLGIPHEKTNIWGGAIALGHPLGASGARIVMNLEQQLFEIGGRYGIACACNGGGEAMAVLIENMHSRA